MHRVLLSAVCVFASLFASPAGASARSTGRGAEPAGDLPCPLEFAYDGRERLLVANPARWGTAGVSVTAAPNNPAPVVLAFVSKDAGWLEFGQISVGPGKSVVVGSTEDMAIVLLPPVIKDAVGSVCAVPAPVAEPALVGIADGCGGSDEVRSVRAEGWVSFTFTVPSSQRCPVDIVLEAEHPDTGARTVIRQARVIVGGTVVLEGHNPPPAYPPGNPTPFLRVRLSCPFEPESTCQVVMSGGLIPATEDHVMADVAASAPCGGAIFDSETSVPAVIDVFVRNQSVPGSPSCPLQVNITFDNLPQGVPQPFPDPIELSEGQDIALRLDNTTNPTTVRVSVVCFFSPNGTCQPAVRMSRGTAGTYLGEYDWTSRPCAENAPAALMMFFTEREVTFTVEVDANSCPVDILRADGQGAGTKKVVTVRPGRTVTETLKPRTTGAGKRKRYLVITLSSQCRGVAADACDFSINVAE